MFMLAPDVEYWQSRLALVAGTLGLTATVGGGAAPIGFDLGLSTVLSLPPFSALSAPSSTGAISSSSS